MLCGLGVPSLRSLWGAITEPAAVHIAHVLQRSDFFQFFNFFLISTTYSKKKLHDLPQRLKNSIFFYNSHDLQQKKITRIYSKKKLHDYTVFLDPTYIFHVIFFGIIG